LAEEGVLDGVGALADQSMVALRDWGGAHPRMEMLETIREHTFERLEEAGEGDELRKRHASYFLALAERAEPGLEECGAAGRFALLEREHDNLRAALARFWFIRGHYAEGRAWLERFPDPQDVARDPVWGLLPRSGPDGLMPYTTEHGNNQR
jgi:predicted ATPase